MLQQVIKHLDVFMVANFTVLALVVAIVIDRAIYFLGRGHINSKAFLEQIKRLLAANNIDRAKKLCDAAKLPPNNIIIYTVQVNTGGDATSTVLQNCASGTDKFYLVTDPDQTLTVFNSIGQSLARLRVAK